MAPVFNTRNRLSRFPTKSKKDYYYYNVSRIEFVLRFKRSYHHFGKTAQVSN